MSKGVILACIGDMSAEDYGGGIVCYSRSNGFWLEYTHGAEGEPDREQDKHGNPKTLPVYTVDVCRSKAEFLREYDWVDWAGVSSSCGEEDILRTCDLTTPVGRACALESAAGYHGWYEFDQYPVDTKYHTIARWYNRWRTRYNRLQRARAPMPGLHRGME